MDWFVVMTLVGLGVVIFSLRYAWWRASIPESYPRILMYHMVSQPIKNGTYNKLRVSPETFEKQAWHLKSVGYQFIFMSELSECGPKSVVLTFDDGYRDNLVNADKVLEAIGGKATLYLVSNRHGRDWSILKNPEHNSGELRDEEKLTDGDVKAMLSTGRWELGSHTLTHAYLPSIEQEEATHEIAGSKQILEEMFGVPVRSFAYPFGIYGERDVRTVRNAGFETACTTEEGISRVNFQNALELPRIKVRGGESMFAFKLRLRTGRRK